MLYVGLGGTGCRVGAELERGLREELCGPELPSCLQFVYADLSEDEFGALERRAGPHPGHLVQDLVRHNTYPELARSLRLTVPQYVHAWLPPPEGEPRIGPLTRGAGQLPTVGRAVLFEAFRNGLAAVQDPLHKAVGAITDSLGGSSSSCDVFVAFSVAGGTGGGIFFDFLHLIGDVFADHGRRARVYPLVLMPSAFDEGLGGGRAARLNAGRSLLDLFRLVDDQNAQATELWVDYPYRERIRLRASTVRTAFLFGKGAGVRREDLHRSIVSLMLSLIGTDAESFVNSATERGLPAPTGIGNRGVSTSSVASMTVPVDDIADLIASRLLAAAIAELSAGQAEDNSPFVERFFAESNVDPLRRRAPVAIKEVPAVSGAEAVARALAARARAMESGLRTLDQRLARQIPDMVQTFDPGRAVRSLLGEIDLFRLRLVLDGFAEVLELRRGEPPAPPGLTLNPPAVAGIRGRFLGKPRFSDPAVRSALARQDDWYAWRARRVWHATWNDQAVRWEPKLKAVRQQFLSLVSAFEDHARQSERRFTARARELYQQRAGVTYLLPHQGDLEPFYQDVVRLLPAAGALATEIVGDEGWQHAYDMVLSGQSPAMAVAHVQDRMKQAVKRLFSLRDGQNRPLLPAVRDLLAAAAGKPGVRVGDDELARFREKLAGLVPDGCAPSGTGELRILVSYPAAAEDVELEGFLRREVPLPHPHTVVRFQPAAAESITVVLVRTSMGLTDVPEARETLKHWSEALENEEPQDFLHWRQRLGHGYGHLITTPEHLVTTPEHRERILHHLLCAAWNDQITVVGDEDSPSAVTVTLGDAQAAMRLPLEPFGRLSSWAGLVSAYETWVLTDDEQIRRDFCARLTASEVNQQPSRLFDRIVGMAPSQLALITAELDQRTGENSADRLVASREFWGRTLPGALRLPVHGTGIALRDRRPDGSA